MRAQPETLNAGLLESPKFDFPHIHPLEGAAIAYLWGSSKHILRKCTNKQQARNTKALGIYCTPKNSHEHHRILISRVNFRPFTQF